MPEPRFEIYKDKSSQFRWRFREADGRIIFDSDPFTSKDAVMNAVELFRQAVQTDQYVFTKVKDLRKVFVVHGRDLQLRNAIYQFLYSIGLLPLKWEEARALTGKPTPGTREILDAAFSNARALLVLMTPDDEGCLREHLRGPQEEDHEINLTPQPRQNVVLEAGMALVLAPDRTVLVRIGKLRPISDLEGLHAVRLDDSIEKRRDLAERLRDAKCPVKLSGTDWQTAGRFSIDLKGKLSA